MENRKVLEEQGKLLDEIDSLVIKRKANCTELEIDFYRKLFKVLNDKTNNRRIHGKDTN